MIGRRLVNGSESAGISTDDRGLQYGDGLFETMAAVGGRVRRLSAHLARLAEGCRRLGIPMPSEGLLADECARVLEGMGNGTITGCPKVRCMQILAELEGGPRDAYTGSMGYLGLDGSLDMNILIRTLTVEDGVVSFRTGAGIVADSRPEAELAETRAKARGLLRALGVAA